MPAPVSKYRLTRFIKTDGTYDLEEDVCYVGRNRVPAGAFFYPGAMITYRCDDHPDQDMKPDADGRPTCAVCGRQPER
ncbi:MAG: hypothetical protein ACRDIY_08830 [Chloroflexota bacterium]